MGIKHKLLVFIFFLKFSIAGFSQTYISSNAADINDVQSSFINPSISSFQDDQLIVGSKIIQYGFLSDDKLAVKNNYLSLAFRPFPKYSFNTGIQISSLSFPIYSENIASLLTSYQISSRLSIGAQLGILVKSFNKDNFNLVDENDPVFAKGTSKTVFNAGIGIFTILTDRFDLGLGFSHLNQPNISFIDDNVTQPMVVNGAANYRLNALSFAAGVRMIDNDMTPIFSTSYHRPGLGFIRLGYNSSDTEIQLQLFAKEYLSFDYKFSIPVGADKEMINPSHQLSLILKRSSEVEYSVRGILHVTRTDIDSSCYIDKSIANFQKNNSILPQYKTTNTDSIPSYFLSLYKPYIDKYMPILKMANQACKNDHNSKFRIFAYGNKKEIALTLYKFVMDSMNIPIKQLEIGIETNPGTNGYKPIKIPVKNSHKIFFSPEFALFKISPKIKDQYKKHFDVRNWRFYVQDKEGQIVFNRKENGNLPTELEWNFINNLGCPIGPGIYTYCLIWQDKKGKLHKTGNQYIWVDKKVDRYKVDISSKLKKVEHKHKVLELVLGN